jgi:hypothetical protein
MAGARPSIFSEAHDPDIDLSGFAPKRSIDKPAVSDATVRRTSEEGGFPSRPARSPPPKRPVKSGRTVLLNARITQRAHDRFHAIIESERLRYERGEIMHRVTLGEVVELALAALERELTQTDRGEVKRDSDGQRVWG